MAIKLPTDPQTIAALLASASRIDPRILAPLVTVGVALTEMLAPSATERVYSSESRPDGFNKRRYNGVCSRSGLATKRGHIWYMRESDWLAGSAPKPSKVRRPDVSAPAKAATVVDINATLAAAGIRLKKTAGSR